MAKTVAQGGRNGGGKKGGGGEVGQEAAAAALDGTPEEGAAPVEEVTAADCRIKGSTEGVAAGMLAAKSPVNNKPLVSLVDNTQVEVGVDPSWSEAAKKSYKRNKARLSGVNPRLLHGVLDAHNLCKMTEIELERELN
jgi:hypothetical protein